MTIYYKSWNLLSSCYGKTGIELIKAYNVNGDFITHTGFTTGR